MTLLLIVVVSLAAVLGVLVWLGSNDYGTHNKIICRDCENGGHRTPPRLARIDGQPVLIIAPQHGTNGKIRHN